ncbi:MAG: hypothetical protein KR126chlam3_00288 [Chlamydiae bacterium]|nr:hypothetical protein [Chlamydiota bacterium]
MYKNLLALSLLTTSGMIQGTAEENAYPYNTYYCDACSCNSCCCDDYGCDTCSCSPCDCETCCTPKPQESIDCECYTPAFYDLQCDCGFFIDGQFLYWYARETNLPYAARLILKESNAVNIDKVSLGYVKKLEHFDTKWEPGLRVGIGVNSKCDGWDYYLNWTYFHNSEKQSRKLPLDVTNPTLENEIFLNPWLNSTNFLFFSLGTPTSRTFSLFNTIAAKWETRFNQIDLEIGRKYWLSRCFTLRPYAGIRGARTKTVFSEKGTRGPLLDEIFGGVSKFFSQSTDRFKNRLWGAGFFLGLQPNWYFCRNFILYANLDGALLWGEFQSKKKESLFSSGINNSTNTIFVDLRHTSKDSFFTMSALIDLGIGLRWEKNWCCDRYRTSLDLGWEHHIWVDHGYRFKTFGTQLQDTTLSNEFAVFPENYAYDVSNLIYGGLVVRLRFDF